MIEVRHGTWFVLRTAFGRRWTTTSKHGCTQRNEQEPTCEDTSCRALQQRLWLTAGVSLSPLSMHSIALRHALRCASSFHNIVSAIPPSCRYWSLYTGIKMVGQSSRLHQPNYSSGSTTKLYSLASFLIKIKWDWLERSTLSFSRRRRMLITPVYNGPGPYIHPCYPALPDEKWKYDGTERRWFRMK